MNDVRFYEGPFYENELYQDRTEVFDFEAEPFELAPEFDGYETPDLAREASGPAPGWFLTGGTPPMPPVRAGNQVIPIVGGLATFASMVRAIRTATSRGHFIYLLGWILFDNFPLIPGDPSTTIRALFARASSQGVQVRAMLWDQFGTQNTAEVSRINALPNGAAILDNRTVSASRLINVGSHHQKVLIVKGREGLTAFCGGVDINPDRLPASSLPQTTSGSGSGGSGSGSGSGGGVTGIPFHDVHCQIKGPAAHDLMRIFLERWQDHPDHTPLDRARGPLAGLREPLPPPAGQAFVQIGRTYGNGRRHYKVSGGYRFAPNGEQSIRRMVLHAITRARRFIYIEDQYLVNMEVSRALVRVLPNIQHLTIVIPHSMTLGSGDCPQWHHRARRNFIAPLRAAGGSKVRVFHLAPPGAPNTYVHSKTWMIDDEFAIIGSANLNFRSYTHDTESAAGIYDQGDPSVARQLRVALWARHLNMDTPAGRASLADGVTGARFWLALPPGARVAPFNERASITKREAARCAPGAWSGNIDPNGS